MDKNIHKYIVIFLVFVAPLYFFVYLLGDPSNQIGTTFDTILYSTFLLLIALGPLYKRHLIYLYLSVITLVYFVFLATRIHNIINAIDAREITNDLIFLILVSYFTYHIYYKILIIFLAKRIRTLSKKLKMFKNRTNRCPSCNTDLSKKFSKIDDVIKDGYICPYCNSIIGFKKIYGLIALTAMNLWAIMILLTTSCVIFETTCTRYNDVFYIAQNLFLLLFILFLNAKTMYIMKTPDKSSKRDMDIE